MSRWVPSKSTEDLAVYISYSRTRGLIGYHWRSKRPRGRLPLPRIFHTGSSRGAANPDLDTTGGRETAVETAQSLQALLGSPERARRAGASESRKVMDCDDGCMYTALAKSQCELGRSIHPPYSVFAVGQYEISGLGRFQFLMRKECSYFMKHTTNMPIAFNFYEKHIATPRITPF